MRGRAGWDGVRAVVAGFGPAGYAAADNLTFLGASVLAFDEHPVGQAEEQATLLNSLGADVRIGQTIDPGSVALVDVLVTTRPGGLDEPFIAAAVAAGVRVWSDAELAWRLRDEGDVAAWLGIAGSPPVAEMLATILRTAGVRAALTGAGGPPLVEAVMDPAPADVYVVDLTADQLRHTSSMRCTSALALDGAHPEYARVYEGVEVACIYNLEDPATEVFVRDAEVTEGARAIAVTLGMPAVSMLGLVDEILADRAFIEDRRTNAAELGTLADLGTEDPVVVRQALAAAALARAHGLSQQAVRDGLRALRGS